MNCAESSPGTRKGGANRLFVREGGSSSRHGRAGWSACILDSIGNELASYVEDLSMATLWMTRHDAARLINWTPQQASAFLKKLAIGGPSRKLCCKRWHLMTRCASGMLTALESALEVFARVVLPRLSESRFPAEASEALAILRDMESSGVSLLGISPSRYLSSRKPWTR